MFLLQVGMLMSVEHDGKAVLFPCYPSIPVPYPIVFLTIQYGACSGWWLQKEQKRKIDLHDRGLPSPGWGVSRILKASIRTAGAVSGSGGRGAGAAAPGPGTGSGFVLLHSRALLLLGTRGAARLPSTTRLRKSPALPRLNCDFDLKLFYRGKWKVVFCFCICVPTGLPLRACGDELGSREPENCFWVAVSLFDFLPGAFM